MNTNREYRSLKEVFNLSHKCPLCNSALEFGDPEQTEDTLISTFSNLKPPWRGSVMIGLTIKCNKCLQYSITFNVRCRSGQDGNKIENVLVNSEEVSIEIDDVLYEIRNVYSLNETEFSSFVGKEDRVRSVFPLIAENMNDPYNLLTKIQKLIVFS